MSDPAMPGVHTGLGITNTHTIAAAHEVANAARKAGHQLFFVFGIGPTGDHLAGRAVDWSVYDDGTVSDPGPERPAVGRWLANYLWVNRKRLGIYYMIWSRRIIFTKTSRTGTSPNTWHTYGNRPGQGDPHTNHVHVSFLESPPPYQPPVPPSAKTTLYVAHLKYNLDHFKTTKYRGEMAVAKKLLVKAVGAKLDPNGIGGPGTDAAIRAYQKKIGDHQDAKGSAFLGPVQLAKLIRDYGSSTATFGG